jgi:hypothetical protein
MQVSSARPSHNYALQQAHETLLLGTDYLGTNTVARLDDEHDSPQWPRPRVVCEATTQDPRHDTKPIEHVSIRRRDRRVIATGCTLYLPTPSTARPVESLAGLSLFQSRNSLDSLRAGPVGRGDMQLLCPAERYGPRERKRRWVIESGDLDVLLRSVIVGWNLDGGLDAVYICEQRSTYGLLCVSVSISRQLRRL